MKESIYNIKLRFGKHHIVFNTRTSKVIQENEFIYGIEKINAGSADENLQNLHNDGFVVEDSMDEFADVCAIRHKKLFDSSKLVLTLLMSFSCNLECSYCYEYSKEKNTNMTDEVIDNVLAYIEKQINEKHYESLELRFYGGEPLYNMKGCIDVINRAKVLCNKYDVKFKLHVTTNGTLLTEPLLEVLEGVDVCFQITIDGSAETHDRKRCYVNGKGTYNDIIKNLNRLYNRLPQVRFIIRVNYDNEVLQTIPDLLHDIIHMRTHYKITLRKILQLRDDVIDKNLLDKTIALINRLGIVVTCPVYSLGRYCKSTYRNYYVINYDGRVKKCQAFQREEGVIGVLKGRIINLNKDVDKNIAKLPEKCKECKLFPMCLGPCYKVLSNNNRFHCNIQNLSERIKFVIKQKFVAKYAEKYK